jgi:hypothetical protein
MAGPNEPNNETVRVDVPPPTPGKSADSNIKSRETVRIQLPVREPMGKAPLHTQTEPPPPAGSAAQDLHPSQFSEAVRPPSFSPRLPASVMPVPDFPASGLTKETMRVRLVPEPLIAAGLGEKSPMLLWWILLGVSALILIIQIWTYLS